MGDKTQIAILKAMIHGLSAKGIIFGVMFGVVIGVLMGILTGQSGVGISTGMAYGVGVAIAWSIMNIRKLNK